MPDKIQETVGIPIIRSSIRIMGKIFTAEGATVKEAIENLKPEYARGIGVLTLEKGEVKKEKIINVMQIQRLFGKGSSMYREIALKGVSTLFQGVF